MPPQMCQGDSPKRALPSLTGYDRGMERIHYVDGSVVTGTAIAQSLLRFGEALARRQSSATVRIPTRQADGAVGSATFLLGPASQMVTESESSPYDELIDEALVASFEREASLIGVPRVHIDDQPTAAAELSVSLDVDES